MARQRNTRNRRRRTAAAGALAIALAFGPAAAMNPVAYADEGTVTISPKDNADATYDVYGVFIADVADGTGGSSAPADRTATHIAWKSDAVKTATLAYLDENGYRAWLAGNGHAGTGAGEIAQNAAEYIGKMIRESATDVDAGTTPDTKVGNSFANGLAQALASAGIDKQTATAGNPFTADEGLYLFVTAPGSIAADEAGSAAMWIPIGSGATTITEKTATGTTTKTVKDDSSTSYGRAADANKGQDLSFRISTSLPDNIQAYRTYHWRVDDAFPTGMSLASTGTAGVRVTIGNADISDQARISFDAGTLSVDIPDVLQMDNGVTVKKGDAIVVEYAAHLDDSAAIGADGNRNRVTCTHTADPVGEGEIADTPADAVVCTYQLDLVKLDKSTSEPLADARFTMQVANNNTDQASAGMYVQQDGSLAQTAYEFTTDADGTFSVPRIDEGIYVLHETQAPDGYDLQDDDITVTVQSTLDQENGGVTSLVASVSGGEAATAPEVGTHLDSTDTASGVIAIVTSDDRRIELPITGLSGNAPFYVTAAIIAGASIVIAVRRKKPAKAQPGK